MTAKRFTIDFDNRRIIDNKKNEYLVFLAQFKEVLNQLNDENEQLKHRLAISEKANFVSSFEKENERLKKQLASIDRLIDNKIDEFKNGDYGDLPCNTIHMFLDLKQEIGDLE